MATPATPRLLTVQDFINKGLTYQDAIVAYQTQTQTSSSSFGWFREAMAPLAYIIDDPEIEAALRAGVEYERTSTSLFGRFTPEQLLAYGISPISSPFGGTPFVQSVPPTAPTSSAPSATPYPHTASRPRSSPSPDT